MSKETQDSPLPADRDLRKNAYLAQFLMPTFTWMRLYTTQSQTYNNTV